MNKGGSAGDYAYGESGIEGTNDSAVLECKVSRTATW